MNVIPRIFQAYRYMFGETGQYCCDLFAIRTIMTLGRVLKKSENGATTYLIKVRYSNKNVDAI